MTGHRVVKYMRLTAKSTLYPYRFILTAFLLSCAAGFAEAQSTYTFVNCNLPDTGLTSSYTPPIAGEDRDYQPSSSQPGYTIYNPVGVSSVTVDNRTGLMWVTNPVDAGMTVTYSWEGALKACKLYIGGAGTYAGYSDWRLPNIRELMSIADYGRASSPKINGTYFLNMQGAKHWSSTTYMPNPDYAWLADFSNGTVDGLSKTNIAYYARCVRGGP